MHIRLNIPAWTWRELALGLATIVPRRRSRDLTAQLRDEIEQFVQGWTAIPLSSARYGLSLAAQALGLAGKRIAVPGYVCPAVLTGLRHAGCEPIAVDCISSSFRYDPTALKGACEQHQADAILAANTYGLDQDYAFLSQLKLPIIEDAAYQAGRRALDGSLCGTRGALGVWSFNFKALTGIGGGVLLLPEGRPWHPPEGWSRVAQPRQTSRWLNYALRSVARHQLPRFFGGAAPPQADLDTEVRSVLRELNSGPMSDLQAALALAQWCRRHQLSAIYNEHTRRLTELVDRTQLLASVAEQSDLSRVHLYPMVLRVKSSQVTEARLAFRRHLHKRGVQTESPYPVLLGSRETLPNTWDLVQRLILVPCGASLTTNELTHVLKVVEEAAKLVEATYSTMKTGATER